MSFCRIATLCLYVGQCNANNQQLESSCNRASGLVVKSNVAIVGPRVRFSAGALRYDVGGYHSRLSRGIPGFESQYRNYSFCSPPIQVKYVLFLQLTASVDESRVRLPYTSIVHSPYRQRDPSFANQSFEQLCVVSFCSSQTMYPKSQCHQTSCLESRIIRYGEVRVS